MANTEDFTATPTWQVARAGPLSVNIQNRGPGRVYYATHTTTPVAVGMLLGTNETHPVEVPGGSNLYVKASQNSAITTIEATQ